LTDTRAQLLSSATTNRLAENFVTAGAVNILSGTFTITGRGTEIALVRRQRALGGQWRDDRDVVSCAGGNHSDCLRL
jgi:hypothetical protein